MTVIFPKIRYTTNYLYDMEAAGFFKGARNFVGPEKVQCIKIVSDNKDSSIFKISSKKEICLRSFKVNNLAFIPSCRS